MAKGKGIVPHFHLSSILELNLEELKSLGIKGIVLDLDNTIVPGKKSDVPPCVKAWIESAKQKGFKLCIFSNTLKLKRLLKISRDTGIPFVRGSFKPRRGGLMKALNFMGIEPRESVIIGDRLLTDIWGGNRIGMWTILVEPLRGGEGLATKIFRLLERLLLRLMVRGEHKSLLNRQNYEDGENN